MFDKKSRDEKLLEVKKMIWESYFENSVLPNIFNLKEYDEKKDKSKDEFTQIAYRPLVEDMWIEEGVMGDPIWLDIGRIIAHGELDYLAKFINKNIEPVTCVKNLEYSDKSTYLLTDSSLRKVYEKIEMIVDSFKETKPDLMILPIKLSNQFQTESSITDSPTHGKIVYENRHTSLLINKSKIRLMGVNSNFKDIALLNSKNVSWIYKPDKRVNIDRERLWVDITKVPLKLDIEVKTKVKIEIDKDKGIKLIKLL